jgi:hypothetical protein
VKNGRVVGGMPQAVDAYVSGKSYEQIDFVKRNILSLYEKELAKYDTENRKYQLKCENRFIIYTKDLKYQDGIMYIPIYMTMLL